jgi:tetratricopeptide (TPR) repeat protein
MNFGLASMYRETGSYAEAAALIEEVLKGDPNDPIVLLEKARLFADQGKAGEATKVWNRVMEIWKDADENYKYYQEALEFGKTLKKES